MGDQSSITDQYMAMRITDIADYLGVDKRTVYKYKDDENWEEDRREGKYVFYRIPAGFLERKKQELKSFKTYPRYGQIVEDHGTITEPSIHHANEPSSDQTSDQQSITHDLVLEYGSIREELGKYKERASRLELLESEMKLLTDSKIRKESSLEHEIESLKNQIFERDAKIKELESKQLEPRQKPFWKFWQ